MPAAWVAVLTKVGRLILRCFVADVDGKRSAGGRLKVAGGVGGRPGQVVMIVERPRATDVLRFSRFVWSSNLLRHSDNKNVPANPQIA